MTDECRELAKDAVDRTIEAFFHCLQDEETNVEKMKARRFSNDMREGLGDKDILKGIRVAQVIGERMVLRND